jgi:hypothetical protein
VLFAGALATIVDELATLWEVAAVPPKLTAVAPVRFVPVIVTLVPPLGPPATGVTFVTVGPALGTVALIMAPTASETPDGDWVAVGADAAETFGL